MKDAEVEGIEKENQVKKREKKVQREKERWTQ